MNAGRSSFAKNYIESSRPLKYTNYLVFLCEYLRELIKLKERGGEEEEEERRVRGDREGERSNQLWRKRKYLLYPPHPPPPPDVRVNTEVGLTAKKCKIVYN